MPARVIIMQFPFLEFVKSLASFPRGVKEERTRSYAVRDGGDFKEVGI
jgi:hypothetical protein